MAFSFGFYNSLDGDRKYNSVQISRIFDGIINDGIYATVGDCFIVEESSNDDEVVVGSGRGWFDHTWNYNDAKILLSCAQSELVLDRIDAVILDINSYDDFRLNRILYIKGVPSQNPEKPELIKENSHKQYPLAYIRRNANSTVIKQTDIENTVGTSECPFVTGIIETINTDELILQWKAQFEDFMTGNGEKFTEWFEELVYILDGDVGGHLFNMIKELQEKYENTMIDLPKGILETGSKNVTIKDKRIKVDGRFDFYTSVFGLNPSEVFINDGEITLTFPAQEEDVEVEVRCF